MISKETKCDGFHHTEQVRNRNKRLNLPSFSLKPACSFQGEEMTLEHTTSVSVWCLHERSSGRVSHCPVDRDPGVLGGASCGDGGSQ